MSSNCQENVGKRFKFLSGPYLGLVFTVKFVESTANGADIKFAQYDKMATVTNEQWQAWGVKEV